MASLRIPGSCIGVPNSGKKRLAQVPVPHCYHVANNGTLRLELVHLSPAGAYSMRIADPRQGTRLFVVWWCVRESSRRDSRPGGEAQGQ